MTAYWSPLAHPERAAVTIRSLATEDLAPCSFFKVCSPEPPHAGLEEVPSEVVRVRDIDTVLRSNGPSE